MSDAIMALLVEIKARIERIEERLDVPAAPEQDFYPWSGGRRPKWWGDIEVRATVVSLHRQVTLNDAIICIGAQVGKKRTPSRSSLSRYWKHLDDLKRRKSA